MKCFVVLLCLRYGNKYPINTQQALNACRIKKIKLEFTCLENSYTEIQKHKYNLFPVFMVIYWHTPACFIIFPRLCAFNQWAACQDMKGQWQEYGFKMTLIFWGGNISHSEYMIICFLQRLLEFTVESMEGKFIRAVFKK